MKASQATRLVAIPSHVGEKSRDARVRPVPADSWEDVAEHVRPRDGPVDITGDRSAPHFGGKAKRKRVGEGDEEGEEREERRGAKERHA